MCPSNRKAAGAVNATTSQDEHNGYNDPWGLAQAFQFLDRDGDGAIRSEDLSAFFGGCVGQCITAEEATSMITLADLDGDGGVGLEEFQRFMAGSGSSLMRKQQQEEEEAMLREVFDVLDANKDGKVGREDLRSAMAMSGYPMSDDELDAMVGVAARLQAPGLSPATITFDTFSKLMMSPF